MSNNTHLKDRRFGISTRTAMPNGNDRWDNKPSSYDEAHLVLIHNGWTSEQADEALEECPDRWIPVNTNTQIC